MGKPHPLSEIDVVLCRVKAQLQEARDDLKYAPINSVAFGHAEGRIEMAHVLLDAIEKHPPICNLLVCSRMLGDFYARAKEIEACDGKPIDGPLPINFVRHVIRQYEAIFFPPRPQERP